MLNFMENNEPCVGLHLYSTNRWTWSADQVMSIASRLSSHVGVPFTHVSGLRGTVIRLKSGMPLQPVLDRRGHMSLMSYCGTRVHYFDQNIEVSVSTDPGSLIVYAWERLLVDTMSLENVIGTAVIAGFCPYAGYLFRYPMRYGPGAYPLGVIVNADSKYPKEERERVSRWNRAYKGFRSTSGYLREVYPLNVVSETLSDELLVDGQTLIEWITSGTGRGTISDVGKAIHLWRLSDDEAKIVRAKLVNDNRIIAEHQHGTFSQRKPVLK